MFEHIGASVDQETGKRRLASAGLTSLILGGSAGFWLGIAALHVAEVVPEIIDDGPMVELVQLDEQPQLKPPAAPTGPAGSAGTDAETPTPEVPPPDTPSEPTDLKPVKPTPLRSQVERPGIGDGDGPPGPGIGGGGKGGTGTCVGDECGEASGPRLISHEKLEVRRRVDPRYPRAASGLHLGRVSCRVELVIDERGTPESAEVRDCPRVFHDSAREALLRWRYYAPRDALGNKVRARTLVVIHYDVR